MCHLSGFPRFLVEDGRGHFYKGDAVKHVIPAVLTLLLAAAVPPAAQPSASVVVRSTIHDVDPGIAPFLHIVSDTISGGSEGYENRPPGCPRGFPECEGAQRRVAVHSTPVAVPQPG